MTATNDWRVGKGALGGVAILATRAEEKAKAPASEGDLYK
jgi:hypothetical protein